MLGPPPLDMGVPPASIDAILAEIRDEVSSDVEEAAATNYYSRNCNIPLTVYAPLVHKPQIRHPNSVV